MPIIEKKNRLGAGAASKGTDERPTSEMDGKTTSDIAPRADSRRETALASCRCVCVETRLRPDPLRDMSRKSHHKSAIIIIITIIIIIRDGPTVAVAAAPLRHFLSCTPRCLVREPNGMVSRERIAARAVCLLPFHPRCCLVGTPSSSETVAEVACELRRVRQRSSRPEIPVNRKAADSRIVFKVKHRADGSFDQFKARLVAKGFMQRLCFEFFSTFSPMETLTTLSTVFAIAVRLGLPIYHADIPQAFVNAVLKDDAWLRLPPGVSINRDSKQHKIGELLRALYGLRHPPQAFNKEHFNFLVKRLPDLQFTQASADS